MLRALMTRVNTVSEICTRNSEQTETLLDVLKNAASDALSATQAAKALSQQILFVVPSITHTPALLTGE